MWAPVVCFFFSIDSCSLFTTQHQWMNCIFCMLFVSDHDEQGSKRSHRKHLSLLFWHPSERNIDRWTDGCHSWFDSWRIKCITVQRNTKLIVYYHYQSKLQQKKKYTTCVPCTHFLWQRAHAEYVMMMHYVSFFFIRNEHIHPPPSPHAMRLLRCGSECLHACVVLCCVCVNNEWRGKHL